MDKPRGARARWSAADESELCSQTVRTSGVYGCSCHGQHRVSGARVARLTPDQKVGSSNLSALTFDVARRSRRRNAQTRIAPQLICFATFFLSTTYDCWGFASVSISVELGVEVRWSTACSVDHVDGSP